MKKALLVILTGGLMLAVGFGVSTIANTISPGLEAEYHNPALFRSWSDPLMQLYWLVPFMTAWILLRVWNACKATIKVDPFVRRGLSFAFNYWIVTLPGMVMSFSSFPVSAGMVITWTISGLAQAMIAGILFARFQP
jgi:hypothetical protein